MFHRKKSLIPLLAVATLLMAPLPSRASKTTKAKSKVISDYWYTVSVKSIPAEIYNDKFVLHGDKIQYLNHVWKKEEGFLNEEQLGAFAVADMQLTPLFFNFRSTYRTTEMNVDGNVHDGNTLVVEVRKAGQSLPTVNHSISSGTFFEGFFPLWIGKELKTLKVGQSASFFTIFENDVEDGFQSVSGSVRVEEPDSRAKQTHTTKLAVDILDMRTYWWVDSKGAPVHTENASTGAIIDRVSKEKAQAFLTHH